MNNIINFLQDGLATGVEALIEFANRFDAETKFRYELTKPGVCEFSLNGCRVAATLENFQELERNFNFRDISVEAVNELAEKVINGLNEMFDYYYESTLTAEEAQAIRDVIKQCAIRKLKNNSEFL